MKRIVLAILICLAPSLAAAQSSVLSTSPWTAGHAPMYLGQGSSQALVQDSGPALGGGQGLGLSELLLAVRGNGTAPYANAGTGPFGTNFCDYDAPTNNPGGYHFICLSPNAQGGAAIVVGAGGTASPQPLNFIVNGVTSSFPNSAIVIGGTTISGGANGDCLTVSAGKLGQQGCSAASITALTGDVTATGPGSAAATLATVNSNVGSFGSGSAIPTFTVNGKGLITAASTASITLASGEFFVGNASNVATAAAMSGDCTITNTGAITCLDTNGTAFGTMAIQNANAVYVTGATLLTGLPTPVNASDAATKAYVDSSAVGLTPHTSANLATAVALPANTYNNGSSGVGATLTANANAALVVDGVTVAVSQRIVVKNESAAANNGIYVVTATGSGSAPYVLTRSTDANTAGTNSANEIGYGTYVLVTTGSVNFGTAWTVNSTVTTIGTSAINWAQFSSSATGVSSIGGLVGIVSLGSGLSVSGSTINTQWTVSSPNIYNNNAGGVGIGLQNTTNINGLQVVAQSGSRALGIMTASPSSAGSAAIDFYTQASRGLGSQIVGTNTNTGEWSVYTAGGAQLGLYQDYRGRVGVQISNPQSSLDVNGIISIAGTPLFTTPQVYDSGCGTAGHDCTTGFNSFLTAVAAGVKGYIPCGTYDTSTGFLHNGAIDGFFIDGAGFCTELRGTAAGINVLQLGNGANSIQHVQIANLSIGSSVTQNSNGVGIYANGAAVAYWELRNITMSDGNLYDGIYMSGVGSNSLNSVDITNVIIFNCGGTGITMFATGASAQQYIDPNTVIAGCGGPGMVIGGGLGGTYLQNLTEANGGDGLDLKRNLGGVANREIFLGPTFDSDSNSGSGVLTTAGGFAYLLCDGCWSSGNTQIGMNIGTNNVTVEMGGAFHFNSNGSSDGAVYISSQASFITIGGGGVIQSNVGPAIQFASVGTSTEAFVNGIQMISNDYPVYTSGTAIGYLGITSNIISSNNLANTYSAIHGLCNNNIGSNTSAGGC